MASHICPCTKCLINITENLDSICCEICSQWYHVNCSGLTLKYFKKKCKQNDSILYCTSCIKENLPFGKLGEKTFEDVLYNKTNSNSQDIFLKQYIKTNKFENNCSICNKNSKTVGTLPCSLCKNLIHKKCSKIKEKITNPNTIINWMCSNCLNNIFPFQNCTNNDIIEIHPIQNTDILDINKIRDEYNFCHMINETDDNEKIEIDFCKIHCDYYDLSEFQEIVKTITKKRFCIFHSNISSLRANCDNLQVLLSQIPITFDVISLTEVWNNQEKNENFNPNKIDGYHKFNGLPGTTIKSGCGFYISENIDFIDRLDLDKHNKNEINEFTAKWIEIINKNDSNILIASIYRHPSKNDTPFYDYLNQTLTKIMKENKMIFITGDFNYNLLNYKQNEEISNFLNCMYSHLLQPNIIYPTRIVDNARPSLIDNIYSNCINREIISGNLIDKISDHMPNFLILQNFKKSELRIKYQKRDYSKFNATKFEKDLNNEDITQEMLKTNNVNSRYTIFQEHLEKIMDKHAPLNTYLKKK